MMPLLMPPHFDALFRAASTMSILCRAQESMFESRRIFQPLAAIFRLHYAYYSLIHKISTRDQVLRFPGRHIRSKAELLDHFSPCHFAYFDISIVAPRYFGRFFICSTFTLRLFLASFYLMPTTRREYLPLYRFRRY